MRHRSSSRYISDLRINRLHEDILDIEKYMSTELKTELFVE